MHKEKSKEKVLQDATNTPERVGLIAAEGKTKQSVTQNSPLAGLDKIQYLEKKQKYKDSLVERKNDDDNDNQQQQAKEGLKSHSTQKLVSFIKSKKVTTNANGNLLINRKTMGVNHNNLVMDLISDKRKGKTNLSDNNIIKSLIALDDLGMPVSMIRSKKIEEVYKFNISI